MLADARLKAQIDLILRSHEDAAAFPADWEDAGDINYLYRQNTILVHERDETRVTAALAEILGDAGGGDAGGGDAAAAEPRSFESRRAGGSVVRITVPLIPAEDPLLVPEILDRLDTAVGRGKATPDHLLYVCPHSCPATEAVEVPPGTVNPFPPPAAGRALLPSRPWHPAAGMRR